MAVNTTFSRLESWEPSMPRGLMPYCLSDSPPAWFTSNSATFTLPAPKSRHKNDFELNMLFRQLPDPKRSTDPTSNANNERAIRVQSIPRSKLGPLRHEPSKGVS